MKMRPEGKQSLTGKTINAIIISILAKALGFAKSSITAAIFGATLQTDAFYMATSILNVFNGLTGATTTVVVPARTRKMMAEGKDSADGLTSALLAFVLVLSAVLSLVIFITAPWSVRVFAPSYSGEAFDVTVRMLRIVAPLTMVFGSVSLLSGVLNSHQRFAAVQFAGVAVNLVWPLGMLLLAERMGIYAMIAGYIAGLVSQLFILVPSMRKHFRFHRWKTPTAEIVRTLALCVPIFISTVTDLLNQVVDRAVASGLPSGNISALYYATQLTALVTGVVTANIVTTLFTALATLTRGRDMSAFKSLLMRACSVLSLVLLPVTVITMVYSPELVRIVFQRGAFGAEDAALTSAALFFYGIEFVPVAIRSAFTRCFHARQDMKTPMFIHLGSVALNIVLNLALVGPMGISGLALATSISAIASCAALVIALRRQIGPMGFTRLAGNLIKMLAATAALCLCVWALRPLALPTLLKLIIVTAAGLAVYVAALLLMREEDVMGALKSLKKLAGRR